MQLYLLMEDVGYEELEIFTGSMVNFQLIFHKLGC